MPRTPARQPASVITSFADETLHLFAHKAVFWPRRETLLIADPHFGKAATFRAAGIPVPGGTTAQNLSRLSDLLHHTSAARLIVLGDFLHARAGRTDRVLNALEAWRAAHRQLEISVIRGNHDRHAGDPPATLAAQCYDDGRLHEPPFTFCHDPATAPADPTLAGHVHPAVRLVDSFGTSHRRACYLFRPKLALLPAFGAFTGAPTITPGHQDRIFVVDKEEIAEIAIESSS